MNLDYRFLVFDGEMPAAAAIQKCWDEYAHVAAPSPVPAVSVVPAEQTRFACGEASEEECVASTPPACLRQVECRFQAVVDLEHQRVRHVTDHAPHVRLGDGMQPLAPQCRVVEQT